MSSYLSQKYEFKPIYFPRIRELIRPRVFKKYVKEIQASHADIFQFTGLQFDGFLSYCLAKKARIKNICAIRGSQDEAVAVNGAVRLLARWCEKKTLTGCDACYTVSEYVASWKKVKEYSRNLKGCIYNFYDFGSDQFNSTQLKPTSIRKELGLGEDTIIIVSTGRFTEEKGFKTILNIILTGGEWENVCFVLVGDGNYKEEFETILSNSNYGQFVRLLGYRSDVSAILDSSDIFLSCTMHETFGNSILEGSYHGLPVVATNVGGIPEIIKDQETGFLIENGDTKGFIKALKILIGDSKLRMKMGDDGRQYVMNKFSEKNIGNRLDRLYQSLL